VQADVTVLSKLIWFLWMLICRAVLSTKNKQAIFSQKKIIIVECTDASNRKKKKREKERRRKKRKGRRS